MGKHKNKKSSKKSKHKLKKSNYSSTSSSDEEWVEKVVLPTQLSLKKRRHSTSSSSDSTTELVRKEKSQQKSKGSEQCSTREDWMNLPSSFLTESNIEKRRNREEQKKQERERQQYNPGECERELNTYWKHGGDGLPKFQKPTSSDEFYKSHKSSTMPKPSKRQSNWKKVKDHDIKKENEAAIHTSVEHTVDTSISTLKNVTEKELNLLAAKIVKAEIMGNTKLVNKLKEELEKSRDLLKAETQDESILLTHTDKQGQSHPVTFSVSDESTKHKRKKNIETHKDAQRVRYFADDDKYSLKQMFENEKYNNVEDSNKEFFKMTAKVRKNDDLEEVFSSNIRQKQSDVKTEAKNRDKAIFQHQQISKSLDNCNKCIQSEHMPKHLMVSMTETTYLALPVHEPLTKNHCLIIPVRHTPCSTQLDENEWTEIINLRKSLVRMFQLDDKEPVFFECATNLHHFPHMVIHCVPLPKEEAIVAPIYFKKAIDECEMEWSQNKKLISLKGRDVRRAVPKELPYFTVSFGMEEGYAHVIEDEQAFPKTFAEEIIGGMLDMHHSKWRKPKREHFDEQSERVLTFSKIWKDFDWTT